MRKPGRRIRQACEVLEEFGPMGSASICDHIEGVDSCNMGKYCSRAVDLGLMTVERGLRSRVNYSIFTVVPDWRVMIEKTHTKESRESKSQQEAKAARNSKWFGMNSVFTMGGA